MKNKRIYVLYAPGGNGHKSAAQTILETMKRRHPSCETLIEDAYGFGAPFLRFSLRIYDSLLKLDPSYVKYGYWLLSAMNTDESLTARFPETVRAMANRLRELQPSLIVSVHSAINAFVVAALKQAGLFGKIPFVIVCTDLTGNFLRSWVHPQADLMVSFLDEGKQQMQQFGIPNRKIAVLGGPIVNPRFSDAQRTQQVVDAETVGLYAQHIRAAGEHLLVLVEDLLDLHGAARGTLKMNLVAVPLAELVGEASRLLMPLAEAHGIAMASAVAPGLQVRADATRLRQVLLNLASNAIKYNRQGGDVRFSSQAPDNGRVVLSVSDSGIGMTEEQLARLFHPFDRLGREHSATPGTGLGLVIAQSLVREMGGTLELRSQPRHGTEALLTLPEA